MPVFVIFVEGADTEPAKLPVCVVESEEHASLLCEGMKESEYANFDFSFLHCTRSDRGKFAVWAKMICDARDGVYGNIVAGIYDMIDGAYSIMSGRRTRKAADDGEATHPDASDDSEQPPAAKSVEAAGGGDVTLSVEQGPAGDASAAVCLLNVYTNGLADERLEKASSVLNSDLTVDEKLWKIDELMPIPPTVSAQKLGRALGGVTKAAVQHTSWYIQNRKGRKDEKIGERERRLRQRGKSMSGTDKRTTMSNPATGCR